MEELSPPDQIFCPRLADHIPSSAFHIPLAQGVRLSLILHHKTQKKPHPCGEGPSAWWQLQGHSLGAAGEREKAARLQLWLAPATKPAKRGSFPHTSQPKQPP